MWSTPKFSKIGGGWGWEDERNGKRSHHQPPIIKKDQKEKHSTNPTPPNQTLTLPEKIQKLLVPHISDLKAPREVPGISYFYDSPVVAANRLRSMSTLPPLPLFLGGVEKFLMHYAPISTCLNG